MNRTQRAIFVTIIITAFYSCVYTVVLYDSAHWNGLSNENDNTLTQKIENRTYFSMTTLSTVGFGDISPKTMLARLIVASQMIFIIIGGISLLVHK